MSKPLVRAPLQRSSLVSNKTKIQTAPWPTRWIRRVSRLNCVCANTMRASIVSSTCGTDTCDVSMHTTAFHIFLSLHAHNILKCLNTIHPQIKRGKMTNTAKPRRRFQTLIPFPANPATFYVCSFFWLHG